MKKFILGLLVGIVLATTGVSGVTRILDKGIDTVKTHTQELSK